MAEALWRALAWVVSRPWLAERIIAHAMRTPDTFLPGYMRRWWLFNPLDRATNELRYRWCPWSIRVHHILRADLDQHLHNHPWNARTLVLLGSYVEQREDGVQYLRDTGDTAAIPCETFHQITAVDERLGAVTMFFMGRKRDSWGFRVDGRVIPWRAYLMGER